MSDTPQHITTASLLMLRTAREEAPDPAAVVRTWPRVALAAHHLSESLGARSTVEGRAIDQIGLDAYSMARGKGSHDWPGTGVRDQNLLQVVIAIEAAAKAVSHGGEHEAAELLGKTLAVLWIGAEYAGSSARTVMNDIEFERSLSPARRAQIATRARDTARRIEASEQIARSFIGAQPTLDPGSASERLHRAVATWDVEAHRAMLQSPSTMVLHGLARMEAVTNAAFGIFVSNAVGAGHLDALAAERMAPALESLPRSWDAVGDTTEDFAWATRPLPHAFISASETLRTELDRAVDLATPAEQASMVAAIRMHAASSMVVASSAQDLLTNRELRGPARAVARLLGEARPSQVSTSVSPTDIYHGRTVPLPREIREILKEPLAHCVLDAHELMRRTAGLESSPRRTVGSATPSGVLKTEQLLPTRAKSPIALPR